NVEHRLQMEMEFQTHTIPDEERAQYRLARAMGSKTVEEFQARQNAHTGAVRKIYQAVLAGAEESAPPVTLDVTGFADPAAAEKSLTALWRGGDIGHVSQRTQELFGRLLPLILNCAGQVAEPDLALMRFEKFVSAYGSRGLLYELFARNPKLIEMLFKL